MNHNNITSTVARRDRRIVHEHIAYNVGTYFTFLKRVIAISRKRNIVSEIGRYRNQRVPTYFFNNLMHLLHML